jgi:very-short-patch-repair endonuclease
MTNIIRFDDFSNSEIRVTEDGRYSVYDVVKFCGKQNPRDAWNDLKKKYPEVVGKTETHKFPGRGQQETPIADRYVMTEILEILRCSPTQESITSNKFYPKTEDQIISVLKKAFHDCEPCPQFYCNGYRIDLYLAKYRIAIECDESSHSAYCKTKESTREKIIKSALGCSFVRFDPYAKDFNLGDVIANIRKLID